MIGYANRRAEIIAIDPESIGTRAGNKTMLSLLQGQSKFGLPLRVDITAYERGNRQRGLWVNEED